MTNLALFEPKLERALVALTEFYGDKITAAAKTDAPWTDRTGNARNGLETDVSHAPRMHRITLFHKVEYGIWLEIAHNGAYRIIMPTLDAQGKAMMATVQTILGRVT